MASEVEICNMALTPLGVARISSLTENSEQAKKCNAIYKHLRDEEMGDHTWAFATARVQLAQVSTSPVNEFDYQFQVPTDCLRILNIDASSYGYRVEGDKVLTNYSTPYIRYIKKVEDTTLFSSQFIAVLVARMKYELSLSLTGSKTMFANYYEEYKNRRRLAIAVDSQSQGTPYSRTSNSLIDSRYGY